MRTFTNIITVLTVLSIVFTGCKESTTTPTPSGEPQDQVKAEGSIYNSWIVEGKDLPTTYQQNYKKMEFTVESNDDYSWKWYGKDGSVTDFTGFVYFEKSDEMHGESGIWNIMVYVKKINGQDLPGGFYGIFAYETENKLLLNIEPDVSSWGKHPTAQEGIGSGQSGVDGVFKFNLSN